MTSRQPLTLGDFLGPNLRGAACTGADPTLFEPLDEDERSGRAPWPPRAFHAAAYCHACPIAVRARCGAWADQEHERGVWGGSWRTGTGSGYSRRRIPKTRPARRAHRRRSSTTTEEVA